MTNFSFIYLIPIVLISLMVSLFSTYKIRQFAISKQIGVFPDERMVHTGFIPRLGGVGILIGFSTCILLCVFIFSDIKLNATHIIILTGGYIIALLGIYDDFKGINAPRKFLIQFSVSSALIYSGFQIESIYNPFGMNISLGVFSIPITYLWLIGITNAINLIDGLDGLAAGIGIIASSTFAIIAVVNGELIILIFCIALVVGLLGFLKYNYNPASIFMGDTGSLFLGFMLAVLGLKVFQNPENTTSILLPIITLAVPIGDTSIAFFRRLNKGVHPFKADKDHLHHRLIYLGLTHKQAVHIIYFISISYAFTTIMLNFDSGIIGSVLLILTIFISTIALKRLGYLEARKYKTLYGDESLIKFEKELAPLSIKRFIHRVVLVLIDIVTLNLSLFIFVWIRKLYGLTPASTEILSDPLLLTLVSIGWFILFFLNDLYNMRWDVSRFDQIRRTNKTILFGIMVLFIITWDSSNFITQSRFSIIVYGGLLISFVNLGRLLIIFVEKKYNILAYAPQTTLLVGATERAKKVLKNIRKNEHLLYNIIGFVTKEERKEPFSNFASLGTYKEIPEIIRNYGIQEIIIALNEKTPDEMLRIVASVDNMKVVFKIIPQFYDVISGHKTEEVIGHPLIRLFPDRMHLWQWLSKRLFDILFSSILFLSFLPFGLLLYFLLLLEDSKQQPFKIINSVGKYGRVFGMLNYNTDKEQKGIHKFLYRTNLYKFPLLINIIMGKMSVVGPRPEPPEQVKMHKERIRFYNKRFHVRPGLTGWAQVKYRYDDSLKSIREQFKQDLFYLENMSLKFDFRILLRSVFILLFKTNKAK